MERIIRRVTPTAPARPSKRLRVAAYARVSMDKDTMFHSLSTQVSYYNAYIQRNPEWEFAGIYADNACTGTRADRPEFQRMLADCRAGKIDRIITKSVSRFSRNTLALLQVTRELRGLGIDVYFEKENIFTLDSKGELLITIMSSLAQEESRSISENVTWGMRRRFAEWMVYVPYERFLGYRKGQDGQFEIIPEEAEIVRYIYRLFMEGKSLCWIARHLTECRILTPTGKVKWNDSTVRNILQNEKYKGEALLQKTIRTDFLTKKSKINEGEAPQYYVENSHPAIVSPTLFDAAQEEFKRRTSQGFNPTNAHCFSGKLFCSRCGGLYGSKKYNGRLGWRCNNQHKRITDCKTPTLRDEDIEAAFVEAFNRAIEHKDEIMDICLEVMAQRCDASGIDAEIASVRSELAYVTELIEQYTFGIGDEPVDPDVYTDYITWRDGLQDRVSILQIKRTNLEEKYRNIQKYLDKAGRSEMLCPFSELLWNNTIDRVNVSCDYTLHFVFRSR